MIHTLADVSQDQLPQQLSSYVAQTSNTASPFIATFGGYLQGGSTSAFTSIEERRVHALAKPSGTEDPTHDFRPTEVAVLAAQEWLQPLRETAPLAGALWKTPHISASECGEVTFEWWRDDRKVTLYFGGGAPEYVKVWGPDIVHQMESGALQSSDSFRSLWSWLNAA